METSGYVIPGRLDLYVALKGQCCAIAHRVRLKYGHEATCYASPYEDPPGRCDNMDFDMRTRKEPGTALSQGAAAGHIQYGQISSRPQSHARQPLISVWRSPRPLSPLHSVRLQELLAPLVVAQDARARAGTEDSDREL